MDEKEKYKTIVLSGGGTKGFCTLGVLQYMQDNQLIDDKIEFLAGTSIGSMICYFLAIGYTPIELVVSLCSDNVFESLKINRVEDMLNQGVYNYSMIHKHCEKLTMEKIGYIPTMRDLKEKHNKELIICTYNFTERKKEYINYINYPDMICLDALRMSSNLPFIFNEYFYNGNEYIDGGFADNLPISCIDLEKEGKRIAILLKDKDIEKKEEKIDEKTGLSVQFTKVLDKFYNLLLIPILENRKKTLETYEKHIDIIDIDVENVKIYKFNLSHSEKLELFSLGYNKAKEYFKGKGKEDDKSKNKEEDGKEI